MYWQVLGGKCGPRDVFRGDELLSESRLYGAKGSLNPSRYPAEPRFVALNSRTYEVEITPTKGPQGASRGFFPWSVSRSTSCDATKQDLNLRRNIRHFRGRWAGASLIKKWDSRQWLFVHSTQYVVPSSLDRGGTGSRRLRIYCQSLPNEPHARLTARI